MGLLAIAIVALTAPVAASAQLRFEITPQFGYRIGGELSVVDDQSLDVELDESASWGVRMDIPVSRSFQIELLWSRQDTRIVPAGGVFQGRPLFDVALDYYHAGVLWQWGGAGQVEPYVVGTIGLARFSPDQPLLTGSDRMSGSAGAGAKVFFGNHFGLRFEGRGFWVDVDTKSDYDHCGTHGCYGWRSGFYQLEASAGVIIAF